MKSDLQRIFSSCKLSHSVLKIEERTQLFKKIFKALIPGVF